jgi:hypothetical protein
MEGSGLRLSDALLRHFLEIRGKNMTDFSVSSAGAPVMTGTEHLASTVPEYYRYTDLLKTMHGKVIPVLN